MTTFAKLYCATQNEDRGRAQAVVGTVVSLNDRRSRFDTARIR